MKRYKLVVISVLLIVFVSSGYAGRKRVTLAPQEGIYTAEDIEKEIIFGREMAAIILAGKFLVTDPRLTRYVSLVGQSIVRHSNRSDIEFYFAVIDSPQINAYATPGGYIFVTTAALNLMANEAELAGVLAHEIAHISDRHIVKALKIRADDKSMTAMMGKILGSGAESATVVFEQAVGEAMEILFSKGLKIEDEFEADKQGLFLSALAGYAPSAYYDFLSRVQPVIESKDGELSNTHPSFSERISRLEKITKDEGLEGLGRTLNKDRFEQSIQNGE
jgi:predicted Zn-dependent protease